VRWTRGHIAHLLSHAASSPELAGRESSRRDTFGRSITPSEAEAVEVR